MAQPEVSDQEILSQFCTENGLQESSLDGKVKGLIVEFVRMKWKNEEMYHFLGRTYNVSIEPPQGLLNYLLFLIDVVLPSGTVERMQAEIGWQGKLAEMYAGAKKELQAKAGDKSLNLLVPENHDKKLIVPGVNNGADPGSLQL